MQETEATMMTSSRSSSARVAEWRAAMPPSVQLHYAMKANPYAPLLAFMARLVDGFDVEHDAVAGADGARDHVTAGEVEQRAVGLRGRDVGAEAGRHARLGRAQDHARGLEEEAHGGVVDHRAGALARVGVDAHCVGPADGRGVRDRKSVV